MKLVSSLVALFFVVGSIACTGPASPGPGEPTLAEVRKLTERFQDVGTALAEGYIRDPFDLCDTAEMMGRIDQHGVGVLRLAVEHRFSSASRARGESSSADANA
jgi:hypothetical protein